MTDKVLHIAANLDLPIESSTWVFDFLAKRGAGKTYCAAVLCEEMISAGIPIIVLDPMGTWWGLKSSATGNAAGMPVVVFGGKHADLPLLEDKIKEMVQSIVQSNISCVIDLEECSDYRDRKIVETFAKELYRINKMPRHVFIEEADIYVPQRPIGQPEIFCKAAVDTLVRRGGNRNIGVSLISQRSAVVDKNVLSQADCMVALRTLSPQDKDAIASWVENASSEKKEKNLFYDSLKSLQNGEGYVWNPEQGIFWKGIFRRRQTLHATREYLKSVDPDKVHTASVEEYLGRYRVEFQRKANVSDLELMSKEKLVEESRKLREGSEQKSTSLKSMTAILDESQARGHALERQIAVLQAHIKEIEGSTKKRMPQVMVPTAVGEDKSFTSTASPTVGLSIDDIHKTVVDLIKEDFVAGRIKINDSQTVVEIKDLGPTSYECSTDKKDGQIAYTIFKLLKGKDSMPGEVEQAAYEARGWTLGANNFSNYAKPMIDAGVLIKTPGKRWGAPNEVVIKVDGEVVK